MCCFLVLSLVLKLETIAEVISNEITGDSLVTIYRFLTSCKQPATLHKLQT